MRHNLLLTAVAAVAAVGLAATAATAQAPNQPTLTTLSPVGAGPAVTVSFGPVLQKKLVDYGPREVADIGRDLQKSVQEAIARSRTVRPVRVDLVLEDAVPNRPTFAQLGRTISLSERSIGIGGARISGTATYADGAQRSIREQFFETELRDERGATPWFDADRAFEQTAYDIGHGRFPDHYQGPGPAGGGHFGYPFTDR